MDLPSVHVCARVHFVSLSESGYECLSEVRVHGQWSVVKFSRSVVARAVDRAASMDTRTHQGLSVCLAKQNIDE